MVGAFLSASVSHGQGSSYSERAGRDPQNPAFDSLCHILRLPAPYLLLTQARRGYCATDQPGYSRWENPLLYRRLSAYPEFDVPTSTTLAPADRRGFPSEATFSPAYPSSEVCPRACPTDAASRARVVSGLRGHHGDRPQLHSWASSSSHHHKPIGGFCQKRPGEQIPSERGRRGSTGMSSTVVVSVGAGSLGPHGIMLFFNADNVQYFPTGCCPTRV